MRAINEIILHCSATPPEWKADKPIAAKVAEIRRWHMQDNGWRDIGYHWLVDRDGDVAAGRPMDQTGAHVMGHNTGTVGVCLIGGADSKPTDDFEWHFTNDQWLSTKALLMVLRAILGVPLKLSGHNDYAPKGCPGFKVMTVFESVAQVMAAPNDIPNFVHRLREMGL